jgi:hypothetical protein
MRRMPGRRATIALRGENYDVSCADARDHLDSFGLRRCLSSVRRAPSPKTVKNAHGVARKALGQAAAAKLDAPLA